MPIYEFYCTNCERDFEHFARSINSSEKVRCPDCAGSSVERKLSVFAARQAEPVKTAGGAAACGRCGDPDGPCSTSG